MADSPLGLNVPRISYADSKGNMTAYFVPDVTGSTKAGERTINWAAYIPLPEGDLSAFMVDRDGEPRDGSMPPGAMRPEEERRLKSLLREQVPSWYADMVDATADTFVQLIYTARLATYRVGRVCLIGDAGVVAPPFTGSGVFKGYQNADGLLNELSSGAAVDESLERWSAEQLRLGQRLLALGDQMEQAFIWDPLDLRTADAESTQAWWKGAVTFPEEFSYEAGR
jgi:2-polyprenyl-6-methoxyphenol hydroxylase-like FAD-dependent oxidoreductase